MSLKDVPIEIRSAARGIQPAGVFGGEHTTPEALRKTSRRLPPNWNNAHPLKPVVVRAPQLYHCRFCGRLSFMSGCKVFAPLLLAATVASAPAYAQYEVDEDSPVWLRALVDVRVARGGSAPSWTDHGPGKTRYGGRSTDAGFERVTRLALAQLAIQVGASLPWGVRAQAQANVQPDIADDYEPWLIEAFVRKEWAGQTTGWGVQAGLMSAPFSLEHIGPAWSPEYSLSASALNSWLWEEITVAGVEGEWRRDAETGPRVGVVVGAGYGPDQLGRLLALRGWTMGDGLSGLNSDLPLPNGARTEIFDERDDRPAAYTLITLSDPGERGALKLGYFDNRGDQDTQGVWHTRLATAGATIHPLPNIDFVVQYLRGKALVRDTTNDSSLRAFYALLSHRRKGHRVSVRYDDFRVNDLDGGNSTRETGDGVTVGYAYEWGLRQRVAVEYTWLDSNRPGSAHPEPSQDGWQLSYRFRY